ncbi:MAG: hypothetical protein JWQ16_2495 [Novosphingobium sp.]|nr:hypothetical protein [Novosphingobium sp.]
MGVPLDRFPDWPAAMPREVALAYTGVSAELLRDWRKRRKVTFRPDGPNGQLLVLRSQLDDALREQFASGRDDLKEDLDFGDD